jgi:hypothetical protein
VIKGERNNTHFTRESFSPSFSNPLLNWSRSSLVEDEFASLSGVEINSWKCKTLPVSQGSQNFWDEGGLLLDAADDDRNFADVLYATMRLIGSDK